MRPASRQAMGHLRMCVPRCETAPSYAQPGAGAIARKSWPRGASGLAGVAYRVRFASLARGPADVAGGGLVDLAVQQAGPPWPPPRHPARDTLREGEKWYGG